MNCVYMYEISCGCIFFLIDVDVPNSFTYKSSMLPLFLNSRYKILVIELYILCETKLFRLDCILRDLQFGQQACE